MVKTGGLYIMENINDDIIHLTHLPFKEDELSEMLKVCKDNDVEVNLDDCDFDSPKKLLNYMINCGIKRSAVVPSAYDDKYTDLIKEYIKLDREIAIYNFNETVLDLLLSISNIQYEPEYKKYIQNTKDKEYQMISEIKEVFSAINAYCVYMITRDETIERNIKEAKKIKSSFTGQNVLSIRDAFTFNAFLASLDPKAKVYHYDIFDTPFVDGMSMEYYFLSSFLPYKAMAAYNDVIRSNKDKVEEYKKKKKENKNVC